jgi:hypothetical protein
MLNNKQINQLFDFTRQKRVRYKDVQIEIVDHLATAIEEQLKENPDLSFKKSLEQVYAEFGIFGFAKIVQAKEIAMQKFWQKRIFQKIKKHYKLPRIIGTLGSSLLLYRILVHAWLDISFVVIGLSILSIVGIIWVFYKQYVMDNAIREYLYVQSYYGIVGPFFLLFYQFPTIWMTNLQDSLISKGIIVIWILSGITPLCAVLFYICMIDIPKELSREFHNKFGKYLELI